ncbi:MFS transporter [Bifidobacterium sp. ESL0775]|uniref:MFS transporter n=1 Tax=Bifidobacterium sp. ESL0775 TaxID=2983230 RepID=UPI0023F8B2E6|nr:MFS transporter [Bifidobacterium sp. ESL0775]WEV68574.1 MFS transporter [Bifidobacterium sp. ESL0775]
MNDKSSTIPSDESLLHDLNLAKPSPLFYKIVVLVAAGMFIDSIDVYMGSSIATCLLSQGFTNSGTNATFLSAGFMGLLIGSLVSGVIGDAKGRKISYSINLLVFGLFTFACTFAPNISVLIICRFIASMGLGAELVTGFTYINEFAPVLKRGHWCAIVDLIANFGVPVAMALSAVVISHWSWRPLFAFDGVLALLIWFFRRGLPESPRWLLVKGRRTEAAHIISQLTVNGFYDVSPQQEKAPQPFTTRTLWKNFFVATVAVTATMVCSYTFTTWMPTILFKRGYDLHHSLWISVLIMLGAPLGCFIGSSLIDRIGRKRLIVVAFGVEAVLGCLYSVQRNIVFVSIVGFALVVVLYVLMASVTAVYIPELFPTRVRFRFVGVANAIAKLCNALMPYLITLLLTIGNENWVYYLIALIAAVTMAIVAFMGPETAEKELL